MLTCRQPLNRRPLLSQIWLGGAHVELLAGNDESARALIERCVDEVTRSAPGVCARVFVRVRMRVRVCMRVHVVGPSGWHLCRCLRKPNGPQRSRQLDSKSTRTTRRRHVRGSQTLPSVGNTTGR